MVFGPSSWKVYQNCLTSFLGGKHKFSLTQTGQWGNRHVLRVPNNAPLCVMTQGWAPVHGTERVCSERSILLWV